MTTDAEHVKNIRRAIAFYNRWRWALILAFTILLTAECVVVYYVSDDLWNGQGLVRNFPCAGLGFPVGVAMGMKLGLLLTVAIHGLIRSIIGIGRSSRLLVQYHDELRGPTASDQH